MIKKRNNIRIGGNIYIVENFNDDEYTIANLDTFNYFDLWSVRLGNLR